MSVPQTGDMGPMITWTFDEDQEKAEGSRQRIAICRNKKQLVIEAITIFFFPHKRKFQNTTKAVL